MDLGLEGKTALITAASGGIGSGIAGALTDAGARVAISARTRAALEHVTKGLASRAGGRPIIVVGDVCAQGGPAQIAAEATAAFGGRVDILVNNAGGARPVTGEADDAFWDEAMTLNFLAARRLTDLISPGMKARNWGRIINISGALLRLNSMERRRPRPLSSVGPEHCRQNSVHMVSPSTRSHLVASTRPKFRNCIQQSNRRRTSSSRTSLLAISGSLMTSGTSWHFSPPHSPATSTALRSLLMAARFVECRAPTRDNTMSR